MAREDDLEAALDNIARQLKEITANPKPSYSVDGQTVSWTDHFRALNEAYQTLKANMVDAEGPFEIRSSGIT